MEHAGDTLIFALGCVGLAVVLALAAWMEIQVWKRKL